MQAKPFSLNLPPVAGKPAGHNVITAEGALVVIGANGAGKTRFGFWLEEKNPSLVHRIAAQKSLTFPDSVRAPAIDEASDALLWGYKRGSNTATHKHNRWGNSPTTGLLNDYERLLEFLFAEEAERNAEFKRAAKATSDRVEPPETKLDIIKRIWEHTLPERELIIGGGKVDAKKRHAQTAAFNARHMSDGERVIFYLIGQALATPANGIIVIDEPELHLHRAVQARLWDEIEAERTDCLFVYITHDLDFAASRVGAAKIWLREFNGTDWEWDIVPPETTLPESLLLRVLGSRKSVLFVEGDNASLDRRIYSRIYEEWSVTPCGSCEHVIHAVGVFSTLSEFHHLNVRGLIDDDERPKSEAEALQKAGVWLLGYTEIENILLTEDVLHIAASELLIEDGHTIVGRAKDTILKHFNTERDKVIARRVARRLQQAARHFQTKARTEAELKAAWDGLYSSVDSSSIFVEEAKRIDAVIASNNYEQAIRLYANKGLFRAITGMFGTINLQNYLCNLLASSKGEHLRSALRQQLPTIS